MQLRQFHYRKRNIEMELRWTGSHDQALLAPVVEEASRAVKAKGGFLGRTALQKLLYFLRRRGVPMAYRFDIHHYGVFCEEVLRDADWLTADGVIVDRSPQERYSNYEPGPALDALVAAHRESVERHREQVREVASELAHLRPEKLELISTLDYSYRWVRATGGTGPWRDAVIARFEELKPGKFPREEIERAYETMVRAGKLEP
jgi:uncharacterized protein YwgA